MKVLQAIAKLVDGRLDYEYSNSFHTCPTEDYPLLVRIRDWLQCPQQQWRFDSLVELPNEVQDALNQLVDTYEDSKRGSMLIPETRPELPDKWWMTLAKWNRKLRN